ncbi:MAG: hypothetical protein ACE144_10780 [Thermodesulfobacteriota bacterium]
MAIFWIFRKSREIGSDLSGKGLFCDITKCYVPGEHWRNERNRFLRMVEKKEKWVYDFLSYWF